MHVTCCFKYLRHANLITRLIGLESCAFHFKEEKKIINFIHYKYNDNTWYNV